MKIALITGVSGQDGALTADRLIKQGYKVIGAVRRGGNIKTGRLEALGLIGKIKLISLEISDMSSVLDILMKYRPDYIYNYAAQSFVSDSFNHPTLTTQINYFGVLNFLEAIRLLKLDTHFFQASSSEIFGNSHEKIQDEETSLKPLSPYAISKCAAHLLVNSYREAYGMHASSGILFNHESELRGREFVTRKISSQLAELAHGRSEPIELGNLDSQRDWGYAKDFVIGMQKITEASEPGNYVLATNKNTTVRDFFKYSSCAAGFDPVFEGKGESEVCYDSVSGKLLCKVNKDYFRPADLISPRGNSDKMHKKFGWSAETSVKELSKIMVDYDIKLISKGHKTF